MGRQPDFARGAGAIDIANMLELPMKYWFP